MKKVIGIAPASFIGDADKSCMADCYKLGNNYIKRIVEAGGIPFGLAPADNLLTEEALDLCDAFVVQGGAEFYPYHFQIIHHALTHGKKYLGICLGQQLIYVYLELRRRVEARGYEGDLVRAIYNYCAEQGPGFSVQKRISGHRSKSAPRGMEDVTKHDNDAVPSMLGDIFIQKTVHIWLSQNAFPIMTLRKLSAGKKRSDARLSNQASQALFSRSRLTDAAKLLCFRFARFQSIRRSRRGCPSFLSRNVFPR
ncbi:MAG: gamma-glutamyl-gamma-aminobutyrate hydrolase family protein [Clostridia bacterium]|nr:gamma-glutamyl-gamma-aminobutyrate hydrolase family protein [Clostridia bacterium]